MPTLQLRKLGRQDAYPTIKKTRQAGCLPHNQENSAGRMPTLQSRKLGRQDGYPTIKKTRQAGCLPHNQENWAGRMPTPQSRKLGRQDAYPTIKKTGQAGWLPYLFTPAVFPLAAASLLPYFDTQFWPADGTPQDYFLAHLPLPKHQKSPSHFGS
jgi:hypothetical protein